MSVKKIIFFLSFTLPLYTSAQSPGKGFGAGISYQAGLNPASHPAIWQIENLTFESIPSEKGQIGLNFQYGDISHIQVESVISWGRTFYEAPSSGYKVVRSFNVDRITIPLYFNYNTDSFLGLTHNFVVSAGLMNSISSIQPDFNHSNKKTVLTQGIVLGIRTGTEMTKIGRFEYGVNYVRNFGMNLSMKLQDGDDIPAVLTMPQTGGQLNLQVIYFFTPRIYNWKKERYGMDGLID